MGKTVGKKKKGKEEQWELRGREVKEVVRKKGEEIEGILKRVIIGEEEWKIIGVYVNGIYKRN